MSVNITLDGKLMFPSKYVGAADCVGKDVNLTISKVQVDELQMEGGRKQKKPVLYFTKTEKMMVLNKTNAKIVASLYGPEMKSWVGKTITIYPTTTRCGKDIVDCIRVRESSPAQVRSSVPSKEEQQAILAAEAAESGAL